MKIPTLVCSLLLSVSAIAQEDAARTKAAPVSRLQQLLRAAAGGDGVAYDASWRWPMTFSGSATTSRSGGANLEEVRGRYDRNAQWIDYDAGRLGKLAVLKAGRHTLLRDGDGPWRLDNLAGARALGMSYLPDPQLILLALAAAAPAATNREIVEVEGRAVERIGMTLDEKQLETLVRAGAIHDPSPDGALQRRLRMAGRGRPRKNGKVVPVDVVVEVDVETRNLRRVGLRAVTEESDMMRAIRRMQRQRGGGVVQAQGRADEPAEEAAEEEVQQGPVRYEAGFPVRSQKGKTVYSIEVTFSRHGEQSAIRLDDAQKQLLGR
jgi:hypothetical protein